MILNPAYPAPSFGVVAGPVHLWPVLPNTQTLRLPRRFRFVSRRPPTNEELAGLGSFLKKVAHVVSNIAVAPIKLVSKKAAANIQKIDNKVIDFNDKIWSKTGDLLHKIGHKIGKNWKWIAIIVAIAVTIYTMGAGATIMAHMISGMQALGHAVAGAVGLGGGAAAAGGASATATAASIGAAAGGAAAGGVAVGAGTAAAVGGTSLATSISTWGGLALSAAKALVNQKAKVSDLSQQQAQAMLQAQDNGIEMGANDPELRKALELRAQIQGAGIPTDANGNPLLRPEQTGAGYLMPDGTIATADDPRVIAARASGQSLTPVPLGTNPPPAPNSFAALTSSPYFLPAAIGGGALLLVLLLRR